jgi:hydroxymethylbilane synthase
VHSAKDLPPDAPDGLALVAVPERRDPRDALVGAPLADVPTGGVIGTGSVRRRAQLAAVRSDLGFANLRGNIETRLAKTDEFDAIVVALAALERLDLTAHVAEVIDPAIVLPQVGQGALAVECRVDDAETTERLGTIDDVHAHRAVDAERAFLRNLGGGCDLPCGALATSTGPGRLRLDVAVASLDGRVLLRVRADGDDPAELGDRAAVELLDGTGARELLDMPGVVP